MEASDEAGGIKARVTTTWMRATKRSERGRNQDKIDLMIIYINKEMTDKLPHGLQTISAGGCRAACR